MAQDSIITLQLAGTYIGVPVACSMAYKQKILNPPVDPPGRDLIKSWFGQPGGAWDNIREDLSDELVWECAAASYDDKVDTVFLVDATGLKITASMPSTHCIQFNVPALNPHPDGHEGRFFMPGIPVASTDRSAFTASFNSRLVVFATAALSIDSLDAVQPDAYRMIPHGKYVDVALGTADVDGWLPYHSEFVKVLGNRRADNCAAFLGGGAGAFDPYTVPAPPP